VPAIVDYDLTVPRGMSLELGGVESEIVIEGPVGDVDASSVEGGITITGVTGTVTANSVEGDILVTGGTGAIRVTGVDGDVTLDNVDGTSVDAGTVDGTVVYRGTIHDGGRYRLTSHDGDIRLEVPAAVNAMVSVATFEGSFEADPAFRVELTQVRPGKRFTFTLGSGNNPARVELESFDGSIQLVRR
jgi:DUF4097 and DUF4098 domain-containing protein YvlB